MPLLPRWAGGRTAEEGGVEAQVEGVQREDGERRVRIRVRPVLAKSRVVDGQHLRAASQRCQVRYPGGIAGEGRYPLGKFNMNHCTPGMISAVQARACHA